MTVLDFVSFTFSRLFSLLLYILHMDMCALSDACGV